ncbi:MAG: glycerol-3-phosphate dehydrogenase [Sphingomonadaceae bacterium]|nr:glycerol-3-phosphate dehydrogenase [Sphingomonadaceae bacterium]
MTSESIAYDIAVIGGGVNGAGIARDAAGRGAKVLLLEKGDLASGTSSASTKLIHGGLRYLEHYEFALVREALGERELLWSIAPHIIWPMRFILPHRKGLRPRWLLRLGLFLYDHIGGRKDLPPTETVSLAMHEAGVPLQEQFRTAFAYSDCWVDDARLVVLNARDAANRGAHIRTHCPVTAMERAGDHWCISAGGEQFRAKAVVNAAGPSVLDIVGLSGVHTSNRMRLVRGSHIIVPRLFDHPNAYFFQFPDGRIFFAIPYQDDFTLVGTTDADHSGSLDDIHASEAEILYLCDGVNGYFQQQITPDDVVWTYSGVRALVDDGYGRPEAATRGYRMELDGGHEVPVLLSVFGGKITSFRHLAAVAVDRLLPHCQSLQGGDWTGSAPLPGGDFPKDGAGALVARLQAAHPFLSDREAQRLVRAYGTIAFEILSGAQQRTDLGQDFGHGLSAREVDHLVSCEWARTAADILWRRSKLGLFFDATQVAALEDYLAA